MVTLVNIHEAKTHFSKLVDKAINGEEIIIGKSGNPVVKLIAIQPKKPKRVPGSLKGKIRISDDFDAPLSADILEEFEGK
jgi:prevent-host-death family protein